MDENEDYFKIGEQLLANKLNTISNADSEEYSNVSKEVNQGNEDQSFSKCLQIYQFFLDNSISSYLQPINQSLKNQIESNVLNLVQILEAKGKAPSIVNFKSQKYNYNQNIHNDFFRRLDIFNILCFSLLLLRNNENQIFRGIPSKNDCLEYYDQLLETRSDEIVHHEQLKEKYKRLLAKLKGYESVFLTIAKKMNIPENADFNEILSEIAVFNFPNNESSNLNYSNDKLSKFIINKFKLENESTTDDIINAIEMEFNLLKNPKTEIDNSIKKFFTQMMDMPENSEENDIKIKLGTVYEELEAMKSEVNFLKGKLSRQKKQNQEALKEIEDLKNRQTNANNKDVHVSFNLDEQPQKRKEKTRKSDDEETPNSEIYILSSEIESLKLSLKDAREKSKTIREQNKILKTVSKEAINESKAKSNTITELTIQINELSLKNCELERSLQEYQVKDAKQNQKSVNDYNDLSDAFDFLSSQIEGQSNELSLTSENRNKLFKIVHAQEKIIDYFEKKFLNNDKNEEDQKEKEISNNSNSNEIKLLESHLISLVKKNDRPDILSILKCESNEPNSNDEKILFSVDDTENDILNSIYTAFSVLLYVPPIVHEPVIIQKDVKPSNESEKVDLSLFKEVCEYLSSLLVFFDKIANSSDTLDWIFSNNYYVSSDNEKTVSLNLNPYLEKGKAVVRETLVNLVQRITYFLEDRQIDIVAPDFLKLSDSIFSKVSQKVGDEKKEDDPDLNAEFANDDNEQPKDENDKFAIDTQRILVTLTVADVLKNYSTKLEEKIDELGIDLKEIKDELVQSEMVNNESKALLEAEKKKNAKLIEEIEMLESKLKNEKRKLRIKEEEEKKIRAEMMPVESGTSVDLHNDSNVFCYYNKVSSKNEEEINDDKIKLKKCQKLIKMMKKKFEKIMKEKENKLNALSDKLIDITNELESNKEVIDQLSKENNELTETLAVMTKRLSQFEIEKDDAITEKTQSIEIEYQEKLNQQKKLNDDLEKSLNELKMQMETEEDAQNIENRNLQMENKDLLGKIEEIRSNYESLINSYKTKFSQFSEKEKTLTEENADHSESLKKMNKELNDARVENKISALKIKTLTEKIDRLTSLHQTQTATMSTKFETALSEKLKIAEIEYESRKKNFLKQLFERLKDFFDFSKSMNEENCLKVVSNLVSQLKNEKSKEKQNRKSSEILDEMKKELSVKSDNELLTKVLLLSNLSSSTQRIISESSKSRYIGDEGGNGDDDDERFKILKGKMVAYETSLKSWRKWANCMNSILSDNFSSYLVASTAFSVSAKRLNKGSTPDPLTGYSDPALDLELRSKVEEKVLSSVGKKRIFRRIEILRNEKIVFLKLLNEFGSLNQLDECERPIGLQTVIGVVICMKRILKISGKLPSISFGTGLSSSILNRSNDSCKYSFSERSIYSSLDNSNYYDDNSESSCNQQKKKPIFFCT